MATPRRKVGNIPLPRPLRKPREQVSLDLNQNVLETSSSRSANKISSLIQEAEDETAQKKSSIENLNLVESESPLGGKDNYSKSEVHSTEVKHLLKRFWECPLGQKVCNCGT